ncbi:MAG: deoxyhypusine synthase [Methanocalculaceae archaeon]|jgi:deoxyhypusine synthase|nr:deoxyhypusine synthase [Methanocalculaceae archaeon]
MHKYCNDPIKQFVPRANMTVNELVSEMGHAGAYNGGSLFQAVEVYEVMLRDPAMTKFFALAGAMVPAGMGGIVSTLMEKGHIDVLTSTGANLTHDVIEAIGCHHYHGTAECDDVDLRREEVNRIYDVLLPNEAFGDLEEFIQDVYCSLPEQPVTISCLLRTIGEQLESGILATAAKHDIPVYCPAFQDSILGLQYWLFSQLHKKVILDAIGDMHVFLNMVYEVKKAGAVLVGGGVPKNFTLQSMLMTQNGFSSVIQLTGDRPDLGGLSGATLDEAKSWGKIGEGGVGVTVYGDATITLPILAVATLERLEQK